MEMQTMKNVRQKSHKIFIYGLILTILSSTETADTIHILVIQNCDIPISRKMISILQNN